MLFFSYVMLSDSSALICVWFVFSASVVRLSVVFAALSFELSGPPYFTKTMDHRNFQLFSLYQQSSLGCHLQTKRIIEEPLMNHVKLRT